MKPAAPTAAVLLVNYLALLLLLVLSAGASFAPLGAWQAPVALIIAATKMALVFLFFMQLRYRSGLVRVFAVAGFFWLALIGGLTFADYLTRGWRL
jgi:cytochrome c oxidase subunit IV